MTESDSNNNKNIQPESDIDIQAGMKSDQSSPIDEKANGSRDPISDKEIGSQIDQNQSLNDAAKFPPPSADAIPVPLPAPQSPKESFVPQPIASPNTFDDSFNNESETRSGVGNFLNKIKSAPTKTKVAVGGGVFLTIVVVIALLFATHVLCIHNWKDADCYSPKTCTICGETEGAPLGHAIEQWITDIEPTCSEKGKEHGNCVRCGEEISRWIDTVAHTPGKWKVTEDYTISSYGTVIPGVQTQYCSVCGAEMGTKEYTVELTMGQSNALKQAVNYLDFTAFSYSGLIDQLEYEGYSTEDATFAVDHCGADWNEQAAKKAQDYLDFMSFSKSGLIDQLEYEGFTREQAEYGVEAVGF